MALRSLMLAAVALTIMVGGAQPSPAQQGKAPAKEKKPGKDSTKSKVKDPTRIKQAPTDAQIAERKAEAEALPLFRSTEPVAFTLIANYKAIGRDRDTLSTRRFPGRLVLDGATDTIPVQVRTRGHYRLSKCSFVPLRIEFPKKETKGTPFDGQKSLKLGTHCEKGDLYEQYVLREHLAYRMQALVSPRYFRTRLARATYVDSASGKTVDTKYALLVESEEHMGARAGGTVNELRGGVFNDVDEGALLNLSLFEYMIGNTDWSIYALHNVRIVQTPLAQLFPVAYDFDFSGLVQTRYSTPDPRLPIKSVRARLFRGPCRSAAEWEPVVAPFRQAKAHVLAIYDSLPPLDPGYAADTKKYLGEFFRTLERPGDFKADIIDHCNREAGT